MKAQQNAVAAQSAKQATTNGTVKMLVAKNPAPAAQTEKPAGGSTKPEAEAKPQPAKKNVPVKAEKKAAIKPAKEEKVNNLQSTLKVVDNLHRQVVQRSNLIHVIDTLNDFTIKQVEDEHGAEFVGCEITIKDDNRNSWITKNTFLIAAIVRFAKKTCETRLAEIEAGIVLPAA